VIAELLGLPISDRNLFRAWADRLFNRDVADPNDPELARKIDEATADMLAYLRAHCADRRAHPRQDLISRLATVQADGERLSDEEVVNFSMVLLLAGHITTTAAGQHGAVYGRAPRGVGTDARGSLPGRTHY